MTNPAPVSRYLFFRNEGIRDNIPPSYDLFFEFDPAFWINPAVAQLFFDPEELVIFCCTIRSGKAAGFDLTAVEGDREVGDRRIFRLAATVAHDRRITMSLSQLHGVNRLSYGSDLIDLDQDAVGNPPIEAFLEQF